MISRFTTGWACGAVAMSAYYELRPTTPFWPILLGAFILSLVMGALAEKYLPK